MKLFVNNSSISSIPSSSSLSEETLSHGPEVKHKIFTHSPKQRRHMTDDYTKLYIKVLVLLYADDTNVFRTDETEF